MKTIQMHRPFYLLNLVSNFNWKNLWILLPAPLLAQIETVIYPLIALFFVISIDLLTALVSYFCQLRQERTTSLKFSDYRYGIISGGIRQTIAKSYQYIMAAIVVFVVEIYGFGGEIEFTVPLINLDATLTKFLLWAFVMIEVKSIDENLKDVSGKSAIGSIADIFTYFREITSKVTGQTNKEVKYWEDNENPEGH
jgi:hypothetical protein